LRLQLHPSCAACPGCAKPLYALLAARAGCCGALGPLAAACSAGGGAKCRLKFLYLDGQRPFGVAWSCGCAPAAGLREDAAAHALREDTSGGAAWRWRSVPEAWGASALAVWPVAAVGGGGGARHVAPCPGRPRRVLGPGGGQPWAWSCGRGPLRTPRGDNGWQHAGGSRCARPGCRGRPGLLSASASGSRPGMPLPCTVRDAPRGYVLNFL
jgi:hypothetical protein